MLFFIQQSFHKCVLILLTLFWTFGNSGQTDALANQSKVAAEQKKAVDRVPLPFPSPVLSAFPC